MQRNLRVNYEKELAQRSKDTYLIGATIWLLVIRSGETKEVAEEWGVSAQNRFVDFVQGPFDLRVK